MSTGWLTVLNAAAPVIGSWLMRWTRSRRRLAVKPTSRRAGRLFSPLLGSSGNSVGLWVELKPATVEVDGGFEVVPVAVAAGGDPDGLDAGVEAFRAGVGDPVGEVGQQAGLVALEGLLSIPW